MVHFTNITFDDEWVYADVYDRDNKVSGKVKVHRVEEVVITDCKVKYQVVKASWAVVRDVNSGKIKQNGERMVAWG